MPEVPERDFERFMRDELKDPRLIGMMSLMLQGFGERAALKILDGHVVQGLGRRKRNQ